MMTAPESRAVRRSMPVLTTGASGRRVGTACRCMFAPMRARVASSFSRNGIMDVADLQFGALPRQAAGTKRGDTPLGGQLRQRVGLVHKLRQLRRSKEALDAGRDRLDAEDDLRDDVVGIQAGHALFGDLFHAKE